jgi:hypothetical protein
MTAVSSTRDEFEAVLAQLKAETPQSPVRPKKSKAFENKHADLVTKLEEEQLPKVDAELAVSLLPNLPIMLLDPASRGIPPHITRFIFTCVWYS